MIHALARVFCTPRRGLDDLLLTQLLNLRIIQLQYLAQHLIGVLPQLRGR